MTATHLVFSRQEINTGRQPEFDLLKSATIFFMICAHVMDVVFSRTWEDNAFCNLSLPWLVTCAVLDLVGPFGFMFSMGASIPFSRHQESREWIARGCRLVAAWFVLRLLYIYPMGCVFAESHGMSMPRFCLNVICCNDILFFAGFFFLFMGVLRKLEFGLGGIVLASTGLFAISHFVSIKSGSRLALCILGNFVMTKEASFPFLNWAVVPALGICWGMMLRHCEDKDRLYLWTGIAGLTGVGAIVLSLYMGLSAKDLVKLCDPHISYKGNILTISASCCLLAVFLNFHYFVTRIVTARSFSLVCGFLSRNLTSIYYVQWVAIPWMAFFFPRPTEKTDMGIVVLVAAGVFCFSCLMVAAYAGLAGRAKGRDESRGEKMPNATQ